MGQLAHFRRIWSADAELQRPTDWRSKLQRADARQHLLELRPLQRREYALLHGGPDLEILGDYDGLREEVVGELLVERQVEADGAAADIKRPMLDIGVGLQHRLEIIDDFARGVDRETPCGKRDIDEQLRAVGAREELLLHELHADERRNEQAYGRSDDGVLHAQKPIEHRLENARKARWLVAMALQFVGQNEYAGQAA